MPATLRLALVMLLAAGTAVAQTAKPLVDVLRVRTEGDASEALVTPPTGPVRSVTCEIVIIGGGLGGTSAALAATAAGHSVCMTEPTLWIGGQATSQGVSAFDDNRYIDSTGGTRSYLDLSRRIREHYAAFRPDPNVPVAQAIQGDLSNPGGCWVSKLCFEPAPAHAILRELIAPALASGKLRLWLHTVPVSVERNDRTLRSVLIYDFEHSAWLRLHARFFVEASEMGDLLALSGLPARIGAESQAETHERNAPLVADPHASQSFTYPFILQTGPSSGSDPKPPAYDKYLPQYTFVVDYGNGKLLTYGFYEAKPGLPGSFWVYRRSVDASRFRSGAFTSDRAMINWSSNDFCDANLLSRDPHLQAIALQGGKRLSLGFAWWLRHAAPRDEGGTGYSELAVSADAMGSPDGLSQHPYMRESRRIVPMRTIVEEDIAVDFQKGSRSEHYPDSVGIGWYPIDIHSCDRQDFVSQTKPYQIPLGALIARDADNLLAVGKTIGATHITNGAYRLHPTEWATGEAVGVVLATSLDLHRNPAALRADPGSMRLVQTRLVQQGHPVFWTDDVPVLNPVTASSTNALAAGFVPMQLGAQFGWFDVDASTLHADPNRPMSGPEAVAALGQRASIRSRARLLSGSAAAATLGGKATILWSDLAAAGLSTPKTAADGVLSSSPVSRAAFSSWLLGGGGTAR